MKYTIGMQQKLTKIEMHLPQMRNMSLSRDFHRILPNIPTFPCYAPNLHNLWQDVRRNFEHWHLILCQVLMDPHYVFSSKDYVFSTGARGVVYETTPIVHEKSKLHSMRETKIRQDVLK